MESNEKYLGEYFLKKTELEQKDEIWRLRVTQEEFLSEIQRLREYEIDARNNSTLNEYHIQRNIEATISIMLMDACTLEEMREQTMIISELSETEFAKDAPNVRVRLKSIKTPLSFQDSAKIYRWIFRKQISFDILPLNVKDEFTKTSHYKTLKNMNKI